MFWSDDLQMYLNHDLYDESNAVSDLKLVKCLWLYSHKYKDIDHIFIRNWGFGSLYRGGLLVFNVTFEKKMVAFLSRLPPKYNHCEESTDSRPALNDLTAPPTGSC